MTHGHMDTHTGVFFKRGPKKTLQAIFVSTFGRNWRGSNKLSPEGATFLQFLPKLSGSYALLKLNMHTILTLHIIIILIPIFILEIPPYNKTKIK